MEKKEAKYLAKQITLSKPLIKQIDALAEKNGLTRSAQVRLALHKYVREEASKAA